MALPSQEPSEQWEQGAELGQKKQSAERKLLVALELEHRVPETVINSFVSHCEYRRIQ